MPRDFRLTPSHARTRAGACAAACAALLAGPAAGQVLFDFEDVPLTGFNGGALTTLTLSTPELSVTLSRPGSPNQFDIYDLQDLENDTLPAHWGDRGISPWSSNDGTAFVANFDRAVQAVSIDMGDVGGDNDTLLLQAYSGADATGTLIDTATFILPSGDDLTDPFTFTHATLTVGTLAPEIRSIRFIGGTESYETPFGTFAVPNSVYYDNLAVTVPEPGSLALLGLGTLALLRRRRG